MAALVAVLSALLLLIKLLVFYPRHFNYGVSLGGCSRGISREAISSLQLVSVEMTPFEICLHQSTSQKKVKSQFFNQRYNAITVCRNHGFMHCCIDYCVKISDGVLSLNTGD